MTVKKHDVIQMLEGAFDEIIDYKDPENDIIECETKRTGTPGELLVTFLNKDQTEDKYIISVSLKE